MKKWMQFFLFIQDLAVFGAALYQMKDDDFGEDGAISTALSTPLLQVHDGKLLPGRFCGRVLKKEEMNYHSAEKRSAGAIITVENMQYTASWTHPAKYTQDFIH
ncbi:hypothetical protein PHMEG_000910 [Phytophthora megakarya]|uniref:Reverse transcriptase RNase H-like domain-containing protein n=1 Tax=Phytophthora megakarya TaxID=4795 RepID=A0A225X4F8_9STRA|nr:hypothetical protein PHMEG_000910 [Phytophthora megakarya]